MPLHFGNGHMKPVPEICSKCKYSKEEGRQIVNGGRSFQILLECECFDYRDLNNAVDFYTTIGGWHHFANNVKMFSHDNSFIVPDGCPYLLEHTIKNDAAKS